MLLKLPFQVEGNEGVWLAELAEELTVHFSLQLVGYTQGMQGCAVALTSLPLGWLADRPWMGRSKVLKIISSFYICEHRNCPVGPEVLLNAFFGGRTGCDCGLLPCQPVLMRPLQCCSILVPTQGSCTASA